MFFVVVSPGFNFVFFSVLAERLAETIISEMIYNVSSSTLNLSVVFGM